MIARVPEVTVEVAKLDNHGEATDEVETVTIRLDIATLCKLEERFGSLERFGEQVKAKPVSATLELLAALCGYSRAEARQRLLPGSAMRVIQDIMAAYVEAIGGDTTPLAAETDVAKATQA